MIRNKMIRLVGSFMCLLVLSGCATETPCQLDGAIARKIKGLNDVHITALLDELSGPDCARICEPKTLQTWGIDLPRQTVFRRSPGETGTIALAWCFDEGLDLEIAGIGTPVTTIHLVAASTTTPGREQIWPR